MDSSEIFDVTLDSDFAISLTSEAIDFSMDSEILTVVEIEDTTAVTYDGVNENVLTSTPTKGLPIVSIGKLFYTNSIFVQYLPLRPVKDRVTIIFG